MVVKLLIEKEEINISAICRETGLNYRQAMKYIEKLVNYGLIKEKRFGRIRIIALNEENKYVPLLKEFMRRWKKAGGK